jgi:hypothetical protein
VTEGSTTTVIKALHHDQARELKPQKVEVLSRNHSAKRLLRVNSGKGIGVVSGRGSVEKEAREDREGSQLGGGADQRVSPSTTVAPLQLSVIPEMRE